MIAIHKWPKRKEGLPNRNSNTYIGSKAVRLPVFSISSTISLSRFPRSFIGRGVELFEVDTTSPLLVFEQL